MKSCKGSKHSSVHLFTTNVMESHFSPVPNKAEGDSVSTSNVYIFATTFSHTDKLPPVLTLWTQVKAQRFETASAALRRTWSNDVSSSLYQGRMTRWLVFSSARKLTVNYPCTSPQPQQQLLNLVAKATGWLRRQQVMTERSLTDRLQDPPRVLVTVDTGP